MTDYSAGSDNKHVEPRKALASLAALLAETWNAFRIWRRTRPFWGGLLIILGASEMLASEQAPLLVVSRIGIRGLGGYLTPTFLLLCGLLLWVTPVARTYHSMLAIVLAIDSWLTSNLGGFLIGMLTSVIGGALAFAWMTDNDYGSSGWLGGIPKIRLRSLTLPVVSRLKERHTHPSVDPVSADSAGSAEPEEALTRLARRVYPAITAIITATADLWRSHLRRAFSRTFNRPTRSAFHASKLKMRATKWITRGSYRSK